jgi:ubiquinone/menaquinone biosynthesis C-methylase UbiE
MEDAEGEIMARDYRQGIVKQMRAEWDSIARRNPFFGVDSSPEFERIEEGDEELFWVKGEELTHRFLSELELGDTSSWVMVELGCGLGRMTRVFSQHFDKVYAIDVSPEMLGRAQDKWGHLSNVEWVLGTGIDLKPIKDASVDFVFSFIVLQHALDENVVLGYIRESARVLRSGGIAFMQFPTYTPGPVKKRTLFSKIRSLVPQTIKQPIKRVLHKKNRNDSLPVSPPANLEGEFVRDYAVWRGWTANVHTVEETIKSCGLKAVNVSGLNTKYTYYTLQKPS